MNSAKEEEPLAIDQDTSLKEEEDSQAVTQPGGFFVTQEQEKSPMGATSYSVPTKKTFEEKLPEIKEKGQSIQTTSS